MLYQKIKEIYTQLSDSDFDLVKGTILLQNDSDGKGDYISKWEHPTLSLPTDAQLAEIK